MHQFFLSASLNSSQNGIYNFSLDRAFNTQGYTHIAVQQITFPKVINQIRNDFQITIGSTNINFYKGDISFQQLITYLQNQLPLFTVKEYRMPSQQTSKIFIKKNDLTQFTISIPVDYKYFFGDLVWVPAENAFISQDICNINAEQTVLLRCSACQNETKIYDKFFDCLYNFTVDNTQNFGFYFENVNPKYNRTRYTGDKQIQIFFSDTQGNVLQLESDVQFCIKIVIFKIKYVEELYLNVEKLLHLYALKNFKKDIQPVEEDDEEQE